MKKKRSIIISILVLLSLLAIVLGIKQTSKFSRADNPNEPANTLYNVLRFEYESGSDKVIKYEGEHNDTLDNHGDKDIYYINDYKTESNPNIVFAGYCWEFVRTTDTGGVKLIYNGPYDEIKKCNNTRANHKGVIGTNGSVQDFSGSYVYGNSYSYDEATGKFTLDDITTATWSDASANSLIGKYTCKSSGTTCTTLYGVNGYKDNTTAYATSYTIGDIHYSQIGTSPFNARSNSIAMVGYMFNPSAIIEYKEEYSKSGVIFGKGVDYNNGQYTLTDTSSSYTNAHRYTCNNISGNCETVRYYFASSYGKPYSFFELSNGKTIEQLDSDMMFSDNVNEKNSNIKMLIETWYKQNMTDYTTYIEDVIYCNYRSEGEKVIFESGSTLSCPSITDQFTTVNSKARLLYPVGTITEFEVKRMKLNQNGFGYWSMSPINMSSYFRAENVFVANASSYGFSNLPVHQSAGIRPVISLKPNTTYDDGNGTPEDPYIVGDSIIKYRVVSSVKNGTITNTSIVNFGSSITINYSPDEHYRLKSVKVDNVAVNTAQYPNSYTFSNVSQNHTIDVEYEFIHSDLIVKKITDISTNDEFNFRVKAWNNATSALNVSILAYSDEDCDEYCYETCDDDVGECWEDCDCEPNGKFYYGIYFSGNNYDSNMNISVNGTTIEEMEIYCSSENDCDTVEGNQKLAYYNTIKQLLDSASTININGREYTFEKGYDSYIINTTIEYDDYLDLSSYATAVSGQEGTYSFKLKKNGTLTIPSIPYGYEYKVWEVDSSGNEVAVNGIPKTNWKLASKTNDAGTIADTNITSTFTNNYTASGSIQLKGTKTLSGRTLAANQFEFQLKNSSGTVLQTKKNAANGSITFNTINYTQADIGKTYTYTIVEKPVTASGYTGDTHTETVSVKITDNGNGTLKVTPTYDSDGIKFANSYKATGSVQFTGTKTLSGKSLAANQFSFDLKNSSGTVLQTKKNAANGSITFDKINYTQADAGKTYTYTITEKAVGTGYTGDSHTETITVAITDNGNGTLTVTPTYDADGIKFANSYAATGSLQFIGTKTLSGKTLTANMFEFELKKDGALIQTKSNAAGGSITFDKINYTQADIGKTYTYTITEKTVGTGYTGDTHTETIKVTIVDNGNGTLTPNITSGSNNFTFANSYQAAGTLTLSGTKVLTNGTLKAGEFSFELKRGNTLLQTVSNTENGSISFSPITYTQADIGKTYTYTITEKNPNKTYYSYDNHTETISVAITDNGNGTLRVTPTYDSDGIKFTNTYSATGSIRFTGTKTLSGRTLAANQFSFDLKRGNTLLQTKKNASNGTITFDTINYTEADIGKTYTYTITEKDVATGYTKDTHTETITVSITDNGNGTLNVAPTYDSDGIKFANSYAATGSIQFSGTKTLSGKTLVANQFSFELKRGTTLLQTKQNAANGAIIFDKINYTQADAGKTYTYTITEKDVEAGYTKDNHTETISVTVVDNGNGTLSTNVTGNTNFIFANSYNAAGTLTFSGTEVLNNGTLKAGEFAFELRKGEDVLQTVTNELNGNIGFSPITYSQSDIGKTYTYTIVQKNPNKSYYSHDTHTETITVKITDNGDGTLKVTPTYDSDGIKFVNNYTATGSVSLKANKSLSGKQLEANQFEFELKKGSTVLQTKKNNASGTVSFTAINYTETDIGKTYTYTINEKNKNEAGYTYDNNLSREVKVAITDNGNGTLKATATYTNGNSFENQYHASGSISFSVNKVLSGRTLANEQFSFELKDSDDIVLQTKSNKTNGRVDFDAISYDESDIGRTYTYTISEVNSGLPGYTYDDHVESISVVINDNGDGTLTPTIVSDHERIFNNLYNASGNAIIELNKNYTNGLLQGGEFAFELRDKNNNVIQTVSNDSTGAITFSPIEYKETDVGKTFTYTIKEINPNDPTIVSDNNTKTTTITITDNGDGTLTPNIVWKDNNHTFVNEKKGKVIVANYDASNKFLEGSILAILDSSNKEVDSWTNTKEKHEKILPAGQYTLVQNNVPDGYNLADPIVFSVGTNGVMIIGDEAVEEIVMINDTTLFNIKVILQDDTFTINLKGGLIRINKTTRSSIDSWSTDGNIHEVNLPFGTYVFRQDIVPSGYVGIEPIDFEITKQGEIIIDHPNAKVEGDKIILINKPLIELPLTGGKGLRVFAITGLIVTATGALGIAFTNRKKILALFNNR